MTVHGRLRDRRCRVTVGGFAVEGLRVGFTITKDLTRNPNTCELAIYNLSRKSRARMESHKSVPVVVEAGYRETGLIVLFAGEMRAAFSRPERDGSWATILRAGDGDKALRSAKRTTSTRPGVSVDRVVKDVFGELQVGAGNLWQALKDGKSVGDVFKMGFSGIGSASEQMDKLMAAQDLEWSVQDGEMLVLPAGAALATEATVLSSETGLEGSPEIDAKGVVTARVRIVPGLSPGYPVQFTREHAARRENLLDLELSSVYRIAKTRYVCDTHGDDWNGEISAVDPRLVAAQKAAKARAAAAANAGATP
jgi:hypothetical protein